MSKCFRKRLEDEITYIDKSIADKHKHDYNREYILEITNINIHASANLYLKKDYYRVYKCEYCNSFMGPKINGNHGGCILSDYEPFLKENKLPFIYADTNSKFLSYNFSELINVRLEK